MPPKRPRQRIEIDTLFAPLPQDLVLDKTVSASAVRLWGLLYVFRWQGVPPDFDRLAAALETTERSIYRWLQELQTTGWIDWDRHASLADRFTLRTSPHGKEIDTSVNSGARDLIVGSNDLTPGSNNLIPRSNKLIPRSEDLTPVSNLSFFDPAPEPQTLPAPSDQNHEKTQKNQKGVGVGALTRALLDRGLNETSVARIVKSTLDPATVIQSLDNMLADAEACGQDLDKARGRFVTRLRLSPPEKGHPYARQRPVQSQPPAHQQRRPGGRTLSPERDAEYDRLIAEAEQRAQRGV